MHIAIIGAGFTGTALSIELLDRLPAGASISLVEQMGVFGRGRAYATVDHRHLLNSYAANMSVRARRPDDFVDWLREREKEAGAESFMPRSVYGRYLEERLQTAAARSDVDLQRLAGQVTHLTRIGSGFRLHFRRSSTVLDVDQAALCVGHDLAELDVAALERGAAAGRVIANPWNAAWRGQVGAGDRVLFVGTGLTMLDQVTSLVAAGHRGAMTAISRRGRLHAEHTERRPVPRPIPLDADAGLRSLVRQIRAEIDAGRRRGEDWRPIIDGLRPLVQSIWQRLSAEERSRFLRHLMPWWESHRHRIAPEVAAVLDELRFSGGLQVIAGKIEAIAPGDDIIEVRFRRRSEKLARTKEFDWVVNCTGAKYDIRRSSDPFVRRLEMSGLIRPGPCSIGIDIDEQSRPLDSRGAVVERLYALGPLGKGALWEITAAREIVEQCAAVAETMLGAGSNWLLHAAAERHERGLRSVGRNA